MSLQGEVLGTLIQDHLKAAGAKGSNMSKFCSAIGNGIVLATVGKSFMTIDTGTVPGVGSGTGVGIVGLSSDSMTNRALAKMKTKGKNAKKTMDAIMSATLEHYGSALLQSTHTPVFAGIGNIQVGSIGLVLQEMTDSIDQSLQQAGAKGKNRKNFCIAVATGIVEEVIEFGTGTVVIVGSPASPTPVPGVGTGAGVIS
jgi:hypothetical protein